MAKALAIVPDLAAVEALGDFDGRPIGSTSIKVTNAGDGLSEALQVHPMAFHLHQEVYVVLRTRVAKIEHTANDDSDDGPLDRSHVLKANAATIVDADLVGQQISVQVDRIRKARDAAQGIQPIPAADGSDPWEDGPAPVPADDPMYDDGDPADG